MNFLETSLNNWTLVLKDKPNEKSRVQQELFKQKNEMNLINYKNEEIILLILLS